MTYTGKRPARRTSTFEWLRLDARGVLLDFCRAQDQLIRVPDRGVINRETPVMHGWHRADARPGKAPGQRARLMATAHPSDC